MKVLVTGLDVNVKYEDGQSLLEFFTLVRDGVFTDNILTEEDLVNANGVFKEMIEELKADTPEETDFLLVLEVSHNKSLMARTLAKGFKGYYRSVGSSLVGIYLDADGKPNITGIGYMNIADKLLELLEVKKSAVKTRDTFFVNMYVNELRTSLKTLAPLAPHYFKAVHTGNGDYQVEAGRA